MSPIFEIDNNDQFRSYSIKDIVSLCFKHRELITTIFVVVTVCVNMMLLYIPSVYETNAKLLIHTETQGSPSFFAGVIPVKERIINDPVKRVIETEMQMVEGRVIAEQVVRELNLQWNQIYHKPLVHMLEPIGTYIVDPFMGIFGFEPDPRKNGFNDTVKALLDSINVMPELSKSADTSSNVFVVTLKSPDPVLAKDILSKLVEVYRNYDIKIKRETAEKAFETVNKKVQTTYADLNVAQVNLKLFLANKRKLPNKHGRDKLLTSSNDITVIQIIKEQIITLEFKLSTMKDTFKRNDDNVLMVKRTIEKLRSRLSYEMELYAQNDSELTTLKRNLKLLEASYLKLKKRVSEISLFIDMNEENISSRELLESALVPRESSWKKDILIGLFGAVIGLLFGLMIAGIREFMDRSIRDDSDVLKYLGIDVLGKIPEEEASTIDFFLK